MSVERLLPVEDPEDPGNSPKYHTGKLCFVCGIRPAGTAWSPFFCQPCNAERCDRITRNLQEISDSFRKQKQKGGA